MDTVSDQELVEQARAGDRTRFDRLAEHYRVTTLDIAYALLGNVADAEDVTQEVLLRA